MDQTARDRAARLLAANRRRPGPLDPLPPDCRPADEAEAYALQDAVHALLEADGFGRRRGWKIGCTTPVMQAFLGIGHPCAGGMFEAGLHEGAGRFAHGGFHHVGVECEIAVELATDLPGRAHTAASVLGAVGAVMAAIEVVDDRYRDYRTLGAPTLIADDFFHAGAVLGPRVRDWRALDLAALEGRMTIDGATVGHGRGADILGHPLNVLAWLAGTRPLRAGDIVLLGSLVQTRWVDAGGVVVISVEELGGAVARF